MEKKKVLITGASSGLGAHIASALKDEFILILAGRNLDRTLETNKKVGGSVFLVDLMNPTDRNFLKRSMARENIDILINCAGVNPELSKEALSPEDREEIYTINMSAPIELCNAAYAHFTDAGKTGTIININSVYGVRPAPTQSVYAASKTGFKGFSDSVKDAWLDKNVRMIDLFPWAMQTEMNAGRPGFENFIDPKELAEFIRYVCKTDTFFVREATIGRTRYDKK